MPANARLGPWRRPVNTSANEKGGIHDDATATRLGFAGGTIAGSLHMEQFPPMLLELFGDNWWRTGQISLYFLAATMDGEPVRCGVEATSDTRARIWMEAEDGRTVMAGTAALGDDAESELTTRLANVRPPEDLRMLADVQIGVASPVLSVRADNAAIDARLAVTTEPLPVYEADSAAAAAYGGRVLPMAPTVHLFRDVETAIAPVRGPFVGLFGAIEIQYLNGPLVAEREYTLQGQALALSTSPKTEILWYEATLTDPTSATPVARMVKMDRLMKNASPLWADTAS